MSEVDIHEQITPALHPKNVESLEGYDETTAPYVGPVQTAFSEAYEGIHSIRTARESARKHPSWNEAAQIMHTDTHAQRILSKVTRRFDSVRANLEKAVQATEAQLSGPIQQTGSSSISQEIRAHVKSLSLDNRTKFLEEAQRNGDVVTLSAVLAAPSYLSGLNETERQLRAKMFHEAQSPEVARKLKVMKAAKSLIDTRSGLVFKEVEKAIGVRSDVVQALRQAKNDSEAAFIINGEKSI
ncbi:hypothetical protein [Pseudohongiella sp. O18]|uniref:hypothetical protein n=1 Tax=Pseudohongiella sp. O18 TaxID=2904248 RepID=UPI001F427FD1|nr:hypothetical protein [Pseudohongiella sp. O18]